MGDIVAWDLKNARWKVKLDLDGSTKALKLGNLTKVDGGGTPAAAPSPAGGRNGLDAEGFGVGVKVQLKGLNSAPQYNGTKGEIV